jgi:8-oxo-dGTP pyrophosphatase MutT (NUDIX family)
MATLKEEIQTRLQNVSAQKIFDTERTLAAVVVPFFEKNNRAHLLFTKRTDTVQHHRGEICFPGGTREETDLDLNATALRELQEEVDIPRESVEILGRLDTLRTVSSSYLVVPYVAILQPQLHLRANPNEVAKILEIPFDHFLDPSIFRVEMRTIEQDVVPVYYYEWQGHTIWGITGRILKTLLDLWKEVKI